MVVGVGGKHGGISVRRHLDILTSDLIQISGIRISDL